MKHVFIEHAAVTNRLILPNVVQTIRTAIGIVAIGLFVHLCVATHT